ncbi:type III secretion system export apparatus subunit SctU [Paraburkholderia humisilvae]|uniref:Yop proteins translocation protein U n=1 Tax=Paraburkholderia humisilvae TaxID=627669 RepID=A0A6J5F550_9BURK|nr:type III secretion system export apparatus subunit SctU [Paraburkholderia humisilvae]CAB3772881.1 Yop proteins translocation protein U [Paraburkholderia humisilvae]
MSGEKTEKPTEKKLRDSRNDGKVSRSRDITEAVSLYAPIGFIIATGNTLFDQFRAIAYLALQFVSGDHSVTNTLAQIYRLGGLLILSVAPVLGVAALSGFVASIAQVGFQVSMKSVTPKLENVSPASGLKRIVSVRTLLDMLKTLLKAAAVAAVMWTVIEGMLPLIAQSQYLPLSELAKVFGHVLSRVFLFAPVVFLVFGVVDIRIQRALFMKELKMSKDEVKREFKDSEGDPLIKGERRRIARELAFSAPPGQRVATANMLVVNPTHYAVAVRFQPREHPLPRVVAKAVDEGVEGLRRIARDAGIPIIGNPPVARALYKVNVDEPIPEALFEVVAAILRWLEAIGPEAIAALRQEAT